MGELDPEMRSLGHGSPMGEQARSPRELLTDVYFTDPETVREPEALARRLFGVSRAIIDIVNAHATEDKMLRVVSPAAQPTGLERLLGSMDARSSNKLADGEMFIAEPNLGTGAVLAVHRLRTYIPGSTWELTKKVTVPSDKVIIDNLHNEPSPKVRDVYVHDIVDATYRTAYPFDSSHYTPDATAVYMRVLQRLCGELLRVTDPTARG